MSNVKYCKIKEIIGKYMSFNKNSKYLWPQHPKAKDADL